MTSRAAHVDQLALRTDPTFSLGSFLSCVSKHTVQARESQPQGRIPPEQRDRAATLLLTLLLAACLLVLLQARQQ